MNRKHRLFSPMGGMMLVLFLLLGACAPVTPAPSSGGATPPPASSPTPVSIPSVTPPPAASATPAVTQTSTPAFTLRSFHMVDAKNGWGAGDGRALHTVDGGKTWQDATPPHVTVDPNVILQAFAFDAQTAWVLAPDANDFRKGTLYRTRDGGATWDAAPVPFGSALVQFLSRQDIFLMADRGVAAGSQAVDIYHSSDGGATWNLITHVDPEQTNDNGLPFGGDKSGFAFLDDQHGWVTGFSPVDGATYLYVTSDGGQTWTHLQLELPAGTGNGQFEVEPPVFFSGTNGLLVLRASTNIGQQIFYLTQDGGKTWRPTTPLAAYGQVSYPEPDHVIVWGGATLYTSPDDGKSWAHLTPNLDLSQSLISMQFINLSTGWALSSDGDTTRLYRTVDGGQTWH